LRLAGAEPLEWDEAGVELELDEDELELDEDELVEAELDERAELDELSESIGCRVSAGTVNSRWATSSPPMLKRTEAAMK
jgi:hypothetical protein